MVVAGGCLVHLGGRLALPAYKRAGTVGLALAYLALVGCATVYPDCEGLPEPELEACVKEIRAERELIDEENWRVCKSVYEYHQVMLAQSDHTHDRMRRHTNEQVRNDLFANRCRSVLKDYWADYVR